MADKRVAIVTGAAHGIGAAIASRLCDDGWSVVAADLPDAWKRRAKIPSDRFVQTSCDVSVESEAKSLLTDNLTTYGRLDAVVSNAGVTEFQPLAETSVEDFERVLRTNLTPVFVFAREAACALKDAKGTMVLIGSTRAHMSEPDTLAYSASKGGLLALTHALAISMAPVRVNCVSPGWVAVSDETLTPSDHEQHPAGRVGQPSDIAGAVAFLLSRDAAFITGAELIVDGGMTRKMIYV